jgi:hypothetical protein
VCFWLFSSKPIQPKKIVDVDGTKFDIRAGGQKNNFPTIILESIANGDIDVFHWVAERLQKKHQSCALW